jgi:hypothetical protein
MRMPRLTLLSLTERAVLVQMVVVLKFRKQVAMQVVELFSAPNQHVMVVAVTNQHVRAMQMKVVQLM